MRYERVPKKVPRPQRIIISPFTGAHVSRNAVFRRAAELRAPASLKATRSSPYPMDVIINMAIFKVVNTVNKKYKRDSAHTITKVRCLTEKRVSAISPKEMLAHH